MLFVLSYFILQIITSGIFDRSDADKYDDISMVVLAYRLTDFYRFF